MDSVNEDFVDSIIINLKIIGILQINEKLSIRHGHLHIDREIGLQFLKRWFFRDSRDIILNFLKELIRNILLVFNKIKLLNHEDQVWILSRILSEMESIENGLNNMKTTYSFDPVTNAIIDNIVIKFKDSFQKGKKMLDSLE
jgi:hypothetical protein